MKNKNQLTRGLKLKTCFSTFQDYIEQSAQIKNEILASQPSSIFQQYRRRGNTANAQRIKLNQQCNNKSKLQPQSQIKQYGSESKTGYFDILRVKIHSNQRYNQNAIDSSVVNRKNFKSYLRVQVQKEYNGKEVIRSRGKTANKDSRNHEEMENKKMINSRLEEILNKYAKSQKHSNNSNNNQRNTIFNKRMPDYQKLYNRAFTCKTINSFEQTSKKNPFYTITGWQIQPNQQF